MYQTFRNSPRIGVCFSLEVMEGGYLLGILVLVLTSSLCFQLALSECDRVRGPEGYTDCMYSTEFSAYQWAVCISNANIQTLTKHEHFCQDRSAKYCWYPCMLLLTSRKMNHVHDLCKCDKDKILPKKSPFSVECFIPQTNNCGWYTGCTSSNVCSNGFAKELSIMKELCNMFSRIEGHLSSTGAQYIEAVHKCLRKPFHMLLYPENNLQCKDVRSIFYSASTHCFTSPKEGISIQDLETSDKVFIYLNSKTTLSNYDDFQSSTTSLEDALLSTDLELMRNQVFRVKIAYKETDPRSTDQTQNDIFKSIISESGIQENLLVWITRGQIKNSHTAADILICAKKDCVFDGQIYESFDLKSKLSQVGNGIESGRIHTVTLSSKNVAEVLSFKICSSKDCSSFYVEVDAGGNSGCTALDGLCQDDVEACTGSYVSGKCKSEPGNVRCCTREIYVQTERQCSDVTIYTRDTWGARRDKGTTRLSTPVDLFFIHHTAGIQCDNDGGCSSVLRGIQRDHQDKDWDDIGYNFLVGSNGHIYEGRGWNRLGSHTKGYNGRSLAISFMGNFMDVEPSLLALEATQKFLKCAVKRGFLNKDYSLYGHRDVKSTDCPGTKLYDLIRSWPNYNPATDGDQNCITKSGTCQPNYISCAGSFEAGLCSGHTTRSCCI